jgi:SAM-dependent methyltransferase
MPSTASEGADTPRYGFSFAWDSPYGHVVELLERLALRRGVVLDLGCGFATIAEPLIERGYEYVGTDIDPEALKELSTRGLEAHELDLRQLDELPVRLRQLANGRHVTAVLLLDVIEHLPETRPFLSALRNGLQEIGEPTLLVSVPNISHADIGAKLVFGRWDYTQTGLLDQTHLQFFTSGRLRTEAHHSGFLEVGAHDFQLTFSDQWFPAEHPAISSSSPIAQTMRMWRELADQHGYTVQFIRAFVVSESNKQSLTESLATSSTDESFLTVVMRTQGMRSIHLRDALTCLAAQTLDDFRVLLMVHTQSPDDTVQEVAAIVSEFDFTFASRVEVVHVTGGGRARPLNVALGRIKSRYVAFLDDDDLVTANWVESFSGAANDGAIVRSVAAVRHVSVPHESHDVPYTVESSLEFRYDPEFDPIHHLWGNETPICTFAVPRYLIEDFGLRFDEQLPVLEDWDFLMRCAALAPVRDTRDVTSIYQMWRNGESSASLHDISLWQAIQRILQDRANQRPLVLPAGAAGGLIDMCQQLAQHPAELDAVRHETSAAREETRKWAEEVQRLGHEIGIIEQKYQMTISSLRWRILGPLARVVAMVRRLIVRPKSRRRA